jgi:hypothetical protein
MYNIAGQKQALQNAQVRSANYFLWIAGFTIFNSAVALFTTIGFGFALALGIVDIVNQIAGGAGNKALAIGFAVFMAAIFAAFGWFARSGNIIVFIVGMVLYTLDGLLLLLVKDWIGIAVHGYILYQLYNGVRYARQLKQLIKDEEATLRQQRIMQAESGNP